MDITPIRGMKDLYGLDFRKYQYIIDKSVCIASKYGYQVIETPIVENTNVFQRTLGDETDVVSKEMYSFTDKGGDQVTLRPEGTAGVMRAISSNKMFVNENNPLKLMYYGCMFRYDRPQKGRYRQFHQIGFEHIGEKSPYTDVMTIALATDIFKEIGLTEVKVLVNSLGGFKSRRVYIDALVEYLKKYKNELSNDSKRRLITNPLRILDSKEQRDAEICKDAPKIHDYLTKDDSCYFDKVLKLLEQCNVKYEIDQNLVRGLDYYTHTTFEFKMSSGEYKDALGGGGRYDYLLKMFGGSDISGVGFALGVERLIMLLSDDIIPALPRRVAVIPVSDTEFDCSFELSRTLLDADIPIEFITGGRNLKKRVELATKRGCSLLLIIGENEVKNGSVVITDTRSSNIAERNTSIQINEVVQYLKKHI